MSEKVRLEVQCPQASSLTPKELTKYITSSPNVWKTETRMKLIEYIYMALGFKLEPELLLFLADESEKSLCLAVAGGGKTTTVNVKFILEKIYRKSILHEGNIRGRNMLCLVYNNHNVDDVMKRHAELVRMVKTSGIQGLDDLDYELSVKTVHTFSKIVVETYAHLAGVSGFKLIVEDAPKVSLMTSSVKAQIKKFGYDIKVDDVNINGLLGTYNLMREEMISYNELEKTDAFSDLMLDIDFVEAIFTQYDRIKKRKRQMDFTDLLTLAYDLLKNHKEVRDRIRANFEYIAVDEFQDFTKINVEIVKLISDGIPLTVIGDDDQCIYTFRGANPMNILKFTDNFPNGKVFVLSTNRRCPTNVIELCEEFLDIVDTRYNKSMKGINPNGTIEFRSYRDRQGQFKSVIQTLKEMSDEERNNTVVCYRNKASSLELSDALLENRIHFHTISGTKPFSYPLYKAVFDVLRALNIGTSKKLFFNLYKVLPVTREDMAKMLKYDPEKDEGTDGTNIITLDRIDFGNKLNSQSFSQALNTLKAIQRDMKTVPLSRYFITLLNQIKRCYWDFTCKNVYRIEQEQDIEFTKSIIKYFNVNRSFDELYTMYELQVALVKYDNSRKQGVAISTFHSLKCIEFKNVIALDLQESIFPNFSYIDLKPYSEESKQILKDTEARLMYVMMTRTKKNLIMYYSQDDPSSFITILLDKVRKLKERQKLNRDNMLEETKSFAKKIEEPELDILDIETEQEIHEDNIKISLTEDVDITLEDITRKEIKPEEQEQPKVKLTEVSLDKTTLPKSNFKTMLKSRFL